MYASSGTYVTRSAPAQALLAASRLPGVGVGDIRQSLHLGSGGGGGGSSSSGASSSSGSSTDSSSATGGGQLRTSNTAGFGLGPFGDWEVVVGGIWDVQDGRLARVAFDGFTLQLVGLLGLLKLPSMAKVRCLPCLHCLGCFDCLRCLLVPAGAAAAGNCNYCRRLRCCWGLVCACWLPARARQLLHCSAAATARLVPPTAPGCRSACRSTPKPAGRRTFTPPISATA